MRTTELSESDQIQIRVTLVFILESAPSQSFVRYQCQFRFPSVSDPSQNSVCIHTLCSPSSLATEEMPNHPMVLQSGPKRERPSVLGVVIVDVGLRHPEPSH